MCINWIAQYSSIQNRLYDSVRFSEFFPSFSTAFYTADNISIEPHRGEGIWMVFISSGNLVLYQLTSVIMSILLSSCMCSYFFQQ